jgi:hypothetical protein
MEAPNPKHQIPNKGKNGGEERGTELRPRSVARISCICRICDNRRCNKSKLSRFVCPRFVCLSGNNIIGFYFDSANLRHGFLYDGTVFTPLQYPNADEETLALGIDGNSVVGSYFDAGHQHGFIAIVPGTLFAPGCCFGGLPGSCLATAQTCDMPDEQERGSLLLN